MKKIFYLVLLASITYSCSEKAPKQQEWQLQEVITLDGINPIGLAPIQDNFYLSDGDHNRVVRIQPNGTIVSELSDFDRPMHIATQASETKETLYVPEYGKDAVAVVTNDDRSYLTLNDSLDAPAGISVFNKEIAIADFYTNRILYFNGDRWTSFGKEGKALGDFYYPTDVQITQDHIFVADAYNNRAQVFDKSGKVIASFGESETLNAATGIYVSSDEIFLTDFENNRVLVYDFDYKLKQIIKNGIHKPTDMLVSKDTLYVTNYQKGELVIFVLGDKKETDHEDHSDHKH